MAATIGFGPPGDARRSSDETATILHLGVQDPDNVRDLFPAIRILPSRLLTLVPPGDVLFSVKSTGSDPVIDLNKKTGRVTGLRVGHALVTMRFDGVESETCVVVVSDFVVGDPSACEELRVGSMSQPK